MTKGEQVVSIAKKYLGEREVSGNMGFVNPEFEAKMKAVGFQDTHAWCCYFAEMVFKEAIPAKLKELDKLFSASCVQTFKNFEKAQYPVHALPRPGYLVLWQSIKDGKPQATGHAGIVTELKSTWEFKSIEGNTSTAGSREGVIVGINDRKVLKDVWNGLRILGFFQIWD